MVIRAHCKGFQDMLRQFIKQDVQTLLVEATNCLEMQKVQLARLMQLS